MELAFQLWAYTQLNLNDTETQGGLLFHLALHSQDLTLDLECGMFNKCL